MKRDKTQRRRLFEPLIFRSILLSSLAIPAILSLCPNRAQAVFVRPPKDERQIRTISSDSPVIRDTLFIAPKIVVEAPRLGPAEELFNRSGFVAMIDLGKRRERVEDLSAVLSKMVGVHVKQYGGLGSFATMSIRGSSPNQVQVYLDGIPLNNAYTGTINLADLPTGGVERAEIFRGFAPPHLGSSAIGGAVNLVTLDTSKWTEGKHLSWLEVRESYGSFGTSRHQLSLWSKLWKLKCQFHGSYTTSNGDFVFVDDQGTPENLADDESAVRINNEFDSWNLFGRVRAEIPRAGIFTFSHSASLREQGVPGLGSFQSEVAHSERNQHVAYLNFDPKPILPSRLQISATGFYSNTRDKFYDPNGQIALGRQDTNNKITSYGVTGRARYFPPLFPASIETFFEKRKEGYHPESVFPTPTSGPDRLRSSHSLSLAGELYLMNQTLVLSAAERFEGHTNEFYDEPRFPWLPPSPQGKITRNARTPHLGFRWQPMSFVTFKGNWGKYYRLPTFLELFGNLGSVTGSSTLEPEWGLNRDIGLIIASDKIGFLRRLFFEAVYLDNEVDNLILFFPNSQHTSKPVNIGSAVIKGWEISCSSFITDRFGLSGNYTRLDTEDTSSIPFYKGNQLASRPENEFALFFDWIHAKWKVTYELHYIGANFLDRANLQEVPAREIHNVVVRIDMPVDGLSITAEGRNITDNRVSDVSGFPLPGRTLYTTLSYKY
ncbi:MAG: TonB-dependent receptor [Candidatus Latescibacteria bacterium]|nr:TonB-dependent receptor [Candidatus Latescibacterota bacterium]NIO29066.1 TonB-dependent receptor [Candidatus Latescibacterota bacterium]NIO56691.1 TonB-dependent receptor [Candidatus Latescibacterota bacterium]NIT02274.1 TonB-dependent receptor [Candidatus Latescibacterota bacterium]NIT39159.1 TonB-dependent receptor [Candidatus Latescibacterota bacterium]